MKTIVCLALAIMCCQSGCSKTEAEMSQLERELSEPIKENEIIDDDGVRIKLNYQNAQITLEGNLLSVTQPYVNYFIENMPENSETILYIEFLSGSGTFDLMAEGFTASTNNKRFYMLGLPIGVGKKPFMKIQKGIVKYTFLTL